MQSLILKLFNGTAQCEKIIDQTLRERNVKLEKAEKEETKLLNSLQEEQRKIFDKWRQLQDSIWCDEFDLAYERGFKTGALLTHEIYDFSP